MTAAKILEIKVQASKLQETLGLLAQTQDQLNAINSALEEATKETKECGSTLSKTFSAVGAKIKDFAKTIKKGVLGGLKDSLKVARNLVMALGAAAASAIAISSGAIQRDRESKDSKVSASQLLAYNYAKEQMGMADGEFNLANLQAKLHDINASGDFATLGVRREDLRGLSGIEAMNKVVEALMKKGGANMSDEEWHAYASAAENILGISGERRHLLSDKAQKEFNEHYQWGIANGIDNETLKKGEQAWNKFKFTLNKVGSELSALAMPHIIKALDKLSDVIKTFVNWLKGSAGKNASEILGKIMTSLIDIGQKALPYFMGGLSVLAGVLEKINSMFEGNGFLGKVFKIGNGVLEAVVGEVVESFTKVYNLTDSNLDFKNGTHYYANTSKGEKYADTYEAGLKAIEHLKGTNAYDKQFLLNKAVHNKISAQESARLKQLLKIDIHNHANSDGTITSNVSVKEGGR